MTSIVIDYPQDPLAARVAHLGQQIPRRVKTYLTSFVPILQWIHRYRLSWFLQDLIAGLTVGIVLVPQSMAYAKIATLPPQYGLYTSFVGVSIYCFFGTSKDISIGMISTVSLLVGQAIADVQAVYPEISGPQVAVSLSLFAGLVTLLIGICRLGILVDFIPQPAIAGYMTGSAITISVGQLPKLLGLASVDTHAPPYLVLVSFFKHLSLAQLDTAFGLTSLGFLYLVRFGCHHASQRFQHKGVFYFGIMRNGLVVILGTVVSFLVNRGKQVSVISIIRNVPPGFDALAVPALDARILAASSSVLPSILLLLVLEHLSVAKSFGRISGYSIRPNQEIFAIGVSNVLGSFFGGAPATGAFSRTAINAKSGVKTPCGGLFSALVVVLALYVLTPCFYYIPDAVLSAVVIHAVADLVSSPRYLKALFDTSVLECVVWLGGVVVTVLLDVQTGIYAAVGLGLLFMLFRLARPPVLLLARIPLSPDRSLYVDETDVNYSPHAFHPPGLLIFRLVESMLYPNAEAISESILATVKARTRCNQHNTSWHEQTVVLPTSTPPLRGLILDLTAVHRIDSTGLATLIHMRKTLDGFAGTSVEWHFAGLRQSRLRRDLIYHGFGSANDDDEKDISGKKLPDGEQESGYAVPRDKYPYFHWDVEAAVHFIWTRWNGSAPFLV